MERVMLDRRAFVARLLTDREGLLVVSGLGSPTYDVAAAGDHPLNFYLWAGMGGAAMIGLGLALARPKRRVAVITGDGEALMGLGSFATIGAKSPDNLAIVILDNEHYGETGMQASHTAAGIDLVGVAKASRCAEAFAVSDMHDAENIRDMLHAGRGPILIRARIKNENLPRVLPSRDGHQLKLRFLEALAACDRIGR
jgi:thiamine pyrophosphate-dependent acetolactate synthase large subunit-like protein